MASLESVPVEILLLLAEHVHNIEDYVNLSSTCRALRSCLASVDANTILRLAAAQSRVFFRPSPHYLVAATARQLGEWARLSKSNEDTLATAFQLGMEGVLSLALRHCGLPMSRIRELHAMRFSILNPVEDVIDKCVGSQWSHTEGFWNGGVSDAYTISANPSNTLFQLAIYGELFGPDLNRYIDCKSSGCIGTLSVNTRLEFIKYCVPDFACEQYGHIDARDAHSDSGTLDPRRQVKPVGPYAKNSEDEYESYPVENNNLALVWLLKSSRWRPCWAEARHKAGDDFHNKPVDWWWYEEKEEDDSEWKQRVWENVMICQGLDGLGMIRPQVQDGWIEKIREWRENIAAMDQPPRKVMVGRQATYDCPFLLGDLRICASGYVGGS